MVHHRTVCTPAWPKTIQSSLIERHIPSEIQERIISFLGYRDRISLAATNRHFRRTVYPLSAPLRDRVAVVKAAYEDLQQSDRFTVSISPDSLPCMACFRIRAAEKFDWFQRSRGYAVTIMERRRGADGQEAGWDHRVEWKGEWWKRRCRACVAAMSSGGITEKDKAKVKEWQSRELCWVCRELKLKDEICPGCMEKGPQWDNYRAVRAVREARKKELMFLHTLTATKEAVDDGGGGRNKEEAENWEDSDDLALGELGRMLLEEDEPESASESEADETEAVPDWQNAENVLDLQRRVRQ